MGWGYYDSYYPPYVSVAERRANAAKEVAKLMKKGQAITPVKIEGRKITTSFWGNSWCVNLEAYSDYANRLPRGRTYVRNGSVVHLEIAKGQINALVSGSELYQVKITITELIRKSWQDIKAECAGQIASLVELLQGKLSKQVMEIVTRKGAGLFPKPQEIKMSCSCPDSAGMCKHLAAVMYGVGARLDKQPDLLFKLRHVDHLELIDGAGKATIVGKQTGSGKKTIAVGDLADMFGIEMAGPANAGTVETAKNQTAKNQTAKNQTAKSRSSTPLKAAQAKPKALTSKSRKGLTDKPETVPVAKTKTVNNSKPKVSAVAKPLATPTAKALVAVKSTSKNKARGTSPAVTTKVEATRTPRKKSASQKSVPADTAPSVKSLAQKKRGTALK